jgi:hypothetical protein
MAFDAGISYVSARCQMGKAAGKSRDSIRNYNSLLNVELGFGKGGVFPRASTGFGVSRRPNFVINGVANPLLLEAKVSPGYL